MDSRRVYRAACLLSCAGAAGFMFFAGGLWSALIFQFMIMPRGRTRAAGQPAPALLDFRPVLKNRRTLPYILGYSAHNYELFGQRSWMVAFLVFTASLQPADAPMLVGAATLAATICAARRLETADGCG